jgi:glycosidase
MHRVARLAALAALLTACEMTAPPAPTQTPARAPTASPAPAATATLAPAWTPTPVAPPAPQTGWWNEAVFYEVFVRSFFDADGDGDGDLQGLIAKLDYLNDGDPATTGDLGVTGLWLMPIQAAASYHGYDATDYRAVNPDYGTQDDFKQLIAEAHRRGIKVIVDFVANHTSVEHPWFVASQDPQSDKRDWYIWSDTNPGTVGPWGQQVWHAGASGYYYGVFWSGMPDLNYGNSAVAAEMRDAARFWLQDMGVDGFRLDAVMYLIEDGDDLKNTAATRQWFKDFRSFTKSIHPDALLIGEVWDSVFAMAPYIKQGALDMVFQFELANAFMVGVGGRNGERITGALRFGLSRMHPDQFAVFLANHDMDRVMTQFGDDEAKARLAAAVCLTAPGTPFLYYGEEIGMTGGKPDEQIRTPMQWSAEANAGFTAGTPWIAVNADYPARNVAAQAAEPGSLLSLYRELIALRNQQPALRAGDAYAVDASQKPVYAILRATADEAVLVLLNLGDQPLSDYTLKLDESPLRGAYTLEPLLGEAAGELAALTVDSQGGLAGYQPLPELKPGAIHIFRLQPTPAAAP